MTKHPYQTCLRMPLTLKEDMTTICDEYSINEDELSKTATESYRETRDIRVTMKDTGLSFDEVWEITGMKDRFDWMEGTDE